MRVNGDRNPVAEDEFTVAGDGQSVMNRAALRCHEIVVVCSYQAAAGGILGCADIVNITTGCALSAYHLLVHLIHEHS